MNVTGRHDRTGDVRVGAKVLCMRWEGLFDDLEGQLEAEDRRERDAEMADRTRAERAKIALIERCAASRGSQIAVSVSTGSTVRGRLVDLGADWLLLRDRADREVLVAMTAVVGLSGLSRRSDPAVTARRFKLGYALRALARDRAAVLITDASDGHLTGTIDAVGLDWCELSEHPVDEARRSATVRGQRTIPTAAIVTVLSAARAVEDELD